MAKRTHPVTAPAPPSKPSLSVDLPAGVTLPHVGDKVRVTVRGTVIGASEERRRWDDGRPVVSRVEVEYDKRSVEVSGGKRTLQEIEDSDARI